MSYHKPVMLDECVSALVNNPGGTYVDATFGGGGHSRAILARLSPEGRLYAFDQDPDAKINTIEDERFTLISANFSYLTKHLRLHGVKQVHGILADLGISSHQIDTPERGFSTRSNADLDMRMNPERDFSAKDLVAQYPVEELARVFREYGEFKQAFSMARALDKQRSASPIETTYDLMQALTPQAPHKNAARFWSRLFQAIRIEVNREMEALRQMLDEAIRALRPQGRLVVLSYHSLEDRLVKNYTRYGNSAGTPVKDFYGNLLRPLEPLHVKPHTASESEIAENPRARSVKMRIAARNGE